ncbi:MAG: adenosine deaminase [Candidatus Thorarchaeota archaeon]|nr:adenosine deaminase [Candidatus Thorarchaeota archaeon]
MTSKNLIKALPKIELHLHILGSIRPETLLSIIETDNIESAYNNKDDIVKRFEYSDFMNFIQCYMEIVDYIIDERHFERITYEMLENCARCNTKYVEASFSPMDHISKGLQFNKMLNAIRRGIKNAKRDFGLEADIRIDIVRTSTIEEAMSILDYIAEDPNNIVSIDLGGNEKMYPPKRFADVYRRAAKMGLHRVAHAGEAAGPESIWEAIQYLNVERIGHGVSAQQDPNLIEYLKQKRIGIEMCPVSNLRTGAVHSIKEHPIRDFFDKGLLVSVNSDDPSLFHTDMNYEFIQLHQELGFSVDELFKISLDSIQSSFLDPKIKDQLRRSFTREYTSLVE